MAVDDLTIARFWAKVDKRGDDECWLWKPGGKHYGSFTGHVTGSAHRFSYWLAHGDLPEEVRHTCDVGLCVNPAHLLAGTRLDNERDKDERGRRPVGIKGVPCPKCGGSQDGRSKRGDGREFAFCIPCRKAYNAAYHASRP